MKRCDYVGKSVWGHRVGGVCHVEGFQFGVHVVRFAWSEQFSTGCGFAQVLYSWVAIKVCSRHARVCQFQVRFRAMAFPMAKVSTSVIEHWHIFINNVLPKCADFDTFRQRVGCVNLHT